MTSSLVVHDMHVPLGWTFALCCFCVTLLLRVLLFPKTDQAAQMLSNVVLAVVP